MRARVAAAVVATLVMGLVVTPQVMAADRTFADCAAFNKKYPTGIARSQAEAEAAVALFMARPSLNRKVYLAARKANKALGSPADGVLCEVPLPVSLPSAPTAVTTTLGATRAVYLQWGNPESNGNAPIINYVVRGPGTITVNGNKATIGGLQPGTEYTFEVAAVNKAGEGPAATYTARTNAETPAPVASTPAPSSGATRYANCTAARAAGVTPIRRDTNPALYEANRGLDRDGDGVACE